MGCGLNKLEKRDDKRPGNIYSTLKRPQVETKIDVCYEYRFLEFTTLSAAELPRSSAVRLASLRDLPAQLLDLYQQGFLLVALHPFVQPTHRQEKTPLEHIFRAILIKKTDRSQKTDLHNEGYVLELDCCSSLLHLTDQKIIPEFVKKELAHAVVLGGKSKLCRAISQAGDSDKSDVAAPSPKDGNPESLNGVSDPSEMASFIYLVPKPAIVTSFSLVGGAVTTCSRNEKKIQEAASRGLKFVGVIPQYHCPRNSAGSSPQVEARDVRAEPGGGGDKKNPGAPAGVDGSPEPNQHPRGETPIAEQPSLPLEEGDGAEFSKTLDGPDGDLSEVREETPSGIPTEMEIFALFNKPRSHQECRQYYPVTIPLRVSTNGQAVSGLDANWLEHMSDHFRKGGVLVNAVFQLALVNDSLHSLTDGVFIFEAVSTEDSKTMQGYDAIVVEQWTVLEGVEVQTDYVPLLNSLAAYGWQLTCVLPTPVVKTNREGNVSTKQIVFLQRPCLPQKIKKKESRFQWRFSREDMHSRQMRKSKGKLSARDKREAEENDKNLEDQPSKVGDVGNRVPSRQQNEGALEEAKAPAQGVIGEQLCPDGRLSVEGGAVQNGPTGHCGAPVGGCEGHSGPAEEAREGGAEEVAAETAEDN